MRGLAEIPRLILAAADAKYTDERMTFTMHADGKGADAVVIHLAFEQLSDLRKAHYVASDDAKKEAFYSKTLPEGIALLEKNVTHGQAAFFNGKVRRTTII